VVPATGRQAAIYSIATLVRAGGSSKKTASAPSLALVVALACERPG
jgi:hypothetical protein